MYRNTLLIFFQLWWVLSTAQIDFENYFAIPVGSDAEVVCIDDINNDGLNDVVLGTGFYFDPINDYKLFVFIQDSLGQLNSPKTYSYPTSYPGIKAMDVADINNSGRNDVIIGYGDSIGVFRQNVLGNLRVIQSYYSGSDVDGLSCGDLNNDGLIDIAVSHWNANYIRVFYQSPSGGFTSSTYPKPDGGYDDIEVGDVNNDGLNDVVFMAGQLTNGIHVYTQKANGLLNSYKSYYPSSSSSNTGLHAIAIGKLSSDNRNNVVASMGGNKPSASVVIWEQDTLTQLLKSPPNLLGAYDIPEPIIVDDLDCDGENEIITAHGGWSTLSVFEKDSSGQFSTFQKFKIPYASHYKPDGLSVGDINNDGSKDIAIADYSSGLVLLINKAKVDFKDTVLSETTIDTFFVQQYVDSAYYNTTTEYENNGYLVTQEDSFLLERHYTLDSIKTVETIIRMGVLCSETYYDTTVHSSAIHRFKLISSDTTLLHSRRDSINQHQDFKVYPNPTDAPLTIEIPPPFDEVPLFVNVFDSKGRLVYQDFSKVITHLRKIDLGEHAPGTYLVTLSYGFSHIFQVKVIKFQ